MRRKTPARRRRLSRPVCCLSETGEHSVLGFVLSLRFQPLHILLTVRQLKTYSELSDNMILLNSY